MADGEGPRRALAKWNAEHLFRGPATWGLRP